MMRGTKIGKVHDEIAHFWNLIFNLLKREIIYRNIFKNEKIDIKK